MKWSLVGKLGGKVLRQSKFLVPNKSFIYSMERSFTYIQNKTRVNFYKLLMTILQWEIVI